MIGNVIARLRRGQGVTQEALANYVGVSPQAVSKWENGGVPDTDLLPSIADFFGVSIDTLFERTTAESDELETAICKRLLSLPIEQRFEAAFEIVYALEQALMSGTYDKENTIASHREIMWPGERRYSSINKDEGFTLMEIDSVLPYFMLVPRCVDPEKAYFESTDYLELFRNLSDKAFFDALIWLNKRPCENGFTRKLMAEQLDISDDKSGEIIGILRKYKLLNTYPVDGISEKFYMFHPHQAIPALLIIAREIIQRPHHFTFYHGGGDIPWLR
ncbi:MAG: helix-turn-helix transcriptional regulator [Oscillospiraceae bacterium]|nr:helix-turn-helix transcriptional regulator [Oscillospiraceae bacterium]